MPSPNFGREVKVLLLDSLPESARAIFSSSNFKVDVCTDQLSEAELVKKVNDYNIICLRDHREEQYLTDEVLQGAIRLLAIGVFGKDMHCVDLETAQAMGVNPVFSSPYQHQGSVSEIIISYLVLLARQIGDRSREIHSGEWNKISKGSVEVRGKTLGIVGYGQVGSQLGVMAEALSMRVIFYDTVNLMPIGRAEQKLTLDDVLIESDFVALNVSSIPENNKIIGEAQLKKMKKGSCLINTSCGEAVDLDALASLLKSGHLGGAAIDVFPNEPKARKDKFDSPLRNCPNVILTPHIGDMTIEADHRVGAEVASAIRRFISEGATIGAANFPSVAAWPLKAGSRRILNMHWNKRGVLQEIDYILSAYNVGKQVLDTKEGMGI
ncbi:D-3-phosphoglycerate dehydrogenase [Chytridium lagenaria]|nr:D-3-phosphoglycerate dehydrogenase [Chytridium lagenaria]